MLLLSTGKRRQRKHFKNLKLHAGKQDRKEEEEEEEKEEEEGRGGGEKAFSTRVACKRRKKRRGAMEGSTLKLK